MTPVEFITELFGEDWSSHQLPVFLEMVKKMQEDALRYQALRDAFMGENEIPAPQNDLRQFDTQVDMARQSGLI